MFRHAAASYGQLSLIEFLMAQGANVHIMDSDGDTPLLFSEDPETFEVLIRYGADPSYRNFQNESILEKALDDENLNMIQYLVMKGYVEGEVAAAALSRLQGEGMDEEEDDETGAGYSVEVDCAAEGDETAAADESEAAV